MHPAGYGILALLIAFLIAFWTSVVDVFTLWAGIEVTIYRYGFLVLGCSVYLLYIKQDLFRKAKPSPQALALLLTALLSIAWLVSSLADVRTFQVTLLPLILLSVVTAAFGIEYLRLTSIPALLLLFAMPVWWPLYPYLKDATTLVTEAFLRLIGIPVFVEGYFLHLPNGSFFVDDGCAGLRFILVTWILCFTSIDMNMISLRLSLLLLTLGTALAVVANWIRVIIVVMVGNATNMEHRLVHDHNDLGWVVYGILVLLPLFLFLRHLVPVQPVPLAEKDTAEATVHKDSTRALKAVVPAVIALTVGPALLLFLSQQSYLKFDVSLPESQAGWQMNTSPISSATSWSPAYLNETLSLNGRYTKTGRSVYLHVVNYADQSGQSELINVNNLLADGESWSEAPGRTSTHRVSASAEFDLDVISSELVGPRNNRLLVWYWFEIGQYSTANTVEAKLFQLISMVYQRNDASLVAVAVECADTCANDHQVLEDFVGSHYPALKASLSLPID